MIRRSGGTQRRDRLRHAVLEQRHHIHVALHHHQPFDLLVGLAHLPQAVQFATLVEQGRLGRIEVFGAVVFFQHASTESDHPAAAVMDGEHHAVAELVIDAATVVLRQHAGLVQQFRAAFVGAQRILQCGKSIRRVADGELRTNRLVYTTAIQVGARGVAGLQLPLEELRRGFQCGIHLAAVVVVIAFDRVLRHFHADALGQFVHRIQELQAVVVHQERDGGAVRATTEAVVELLGLRHGEGRRALVMERAACRIFLALAFQRHARADHLDNVGACQ